MTSRPTLKTKRRDASVVNLRLYISKKIILARKMWKQTREEGYAVDDWGPQQWEGYERALVEVRSRIQA